MGGSMSSPVTTLQWLLTESAKVLETATIIVSMTSVVVTNYATNFKDRADAQINLVFSDVEDFLSELSTHGEIAQRCIESRKETLDKLRQDLVTRLMECYKSHDKIFSRLQEGRRALHTEAMEIKTAAEQLVATCTSNDETTFTCLSQGLSRLRRQVQRLMKQVESHAKRELTERRKVLLLLIKCDQRAVKHAYRAVQTVVLDIKKCIFETPQPTAGTSPFNIQAE